MRSRYVGRLEEVAQRIHRSSHHRLHRRAARNLAHAHAAYRRHRSGGNTGNASHYIIIKGSSYRERLSPHRTLLKIKECLTRKP